MALIDGPESSWALDNGNAASNLVVGGAGAGTLSISHGGKVTIGNPQYRHPGYVYLGYQAGSTGVAIVDGTLSTLTNDNDLYVGCSGNGMLTIVNGGSVKAVLFGGCTYVGYGPGTQGTIVVDGTSSALSIGYGFYVGGLGDGDLRITHGGKVTVSDGHVGAGSTSTSTVVVDGAGSTWTNAGGSVYVGYSGDNGKLSSLMISNGGQVIASGAMIQSKGLVAVNVGDGSKLNLGSRPAAISGVLRLEAVPGATVGTYTPVVSGNWYGTGTVQALGGKCDTSSHVFTVSAAAAGVPGVGVGIDRGVQQRVVITDGTTLDCVQAGFMGTSGSSSVTLTGWELTAEQEAGLLGVVPAPGEVLDGWTFATEGYTAGDPVFLSMKVGSGWSAEQLAVWHYDGSAWTVYGAGDLSYDGVYASFTVTGFSGYAVTGVPEPGSLAVMVMGVVGVVWRRRRK